ncbi:MAG: DUF2878 domain-containing protein [Acidobacteriota bacterium]
MVRAADNLGRREDRIQAVIVFVVAQVGWFSCVLGAARDLYWLGPVVVGLLVVLHLVYSRSRRRDLALMLGLAAAGTAMDSLQGAAGLLSFRGAPADWLAPAWIVALWLHFGTMRHSILKMLYGRPWTAALVGAVGGPMAYGAGVGLGAASFHPHQSWASLTALAVIWGAVLPLSSWLSWRGTYLDREWVEATP